MKTLINHLLKNNTEEILSKSLKNCHCKGLHSIMLLESPGKTIRLYVAATGNELYKNSPDSKEEMSIGFHPHHCNLTLRVLAGELGNWIVEEKEDGDMVMKKYLYKSKIQFDDFEFSLIDNSARLQTKSIVRIPSGSSVQLNASEIHTVFSNSKTLTAWLVYEGKEDKRYTPFCWSNSDLTNVTDNSLYEKFDSMAEIEFYLRTVNII